MIGFYLKKDEEVLVFDIKNGKEVIILKSKDNEKSWYEIETDGMQLIVTDVHPFDSSRLDPSYKPHYNIFDFRSVHLGCDRQK